MQMFGIGLPELLLILVLTVIVVGPDKMPEVAGQLARWIRQTRAFAQLATHDFSNVVAELEKEVGASREDLKEIASVIGGSTASITNELTSASAEAREATDLRQFDREIGPPNVVPIDSAASWQVERDSTAMKEAAQAAAQEEEAAAEEPKDQEWFVPSQTRRHRDSSDAV
jgi:sec-independent protein translocase protein TatB